MRFHIEFDGGDITVSTDIPEIADFIDVTFKHMLRRAAQNAIGSIVVERHPIGYEIRGIGDRLSKFAEFSQLTDVLREEVRIQFMRNRPDLLWLHAAAVERNGSALLISGASGQGKSTLSTLLCGNGWQLMSDDVAPTRMDADVVLPYSQIPRRRVPQPNRLESSQVSLLSREIVEIPLQRFRFEEAPIGALLFLRFEHSANVSLERMSGGETAMELLQNAVNFVDHKAAAVERAVLLASRIRGYRLVYGSREDALNELRANPMLN